LGQLIMKLSGQDVLTDMQIAGFIFSPFGFVAFLVFFALTVTIIIFEQASMQAVAVAKRNNEHITALSSLSFALKQAKSIFIFSNRLILRLLVVMIPFLAVAGLVAFLLITEHDINYYLSQKPTEFMMVVAINGVIIALMTALVVKKLIGWSLALPLMLFNGVSARDSFVQSQQMAQANKKEIFFYYIKWALGTMAVIFVVLGLINFVGNTLAARYYHDLEMLVLIMGLFAVLLSLTNFFITIFNTLSRI